MSYFTNIIFIALPVAALGFVASALAVVALNNGAYFYSLPMLALAGLCGAVSAVVFIENF
jgi:hypothetical protein